MKFSPSTGGFYALEIHGDRIPADAVEVSEAQHAALLAGQSQGKRIVSSASGPVLQDPPAPVFAEQKTAELLDFRAKREAYLNRVAGIGFAAKEAGDSITVAAAVTVRQGLLDLPAHPTVTAATDIDSLKLAIRTQYAAIVGGLPVEAKAAFKKVDA